MKNILLSACVGGVLLTSCWENSKSDKVQTMTQEKLTQSISPKQYTDIKDLELNSLVDTLLTYMSTLQWSNKAVVSTPIEVNGIMVEVWFFADPQQLNLGAMSIKEKVYVNLAAAITIYNLNKKIYEMGGLDLQSIPSFKQFIVAILRQEIYHSTTENWGDEWTSDLYTLRDKYAGEFFLVGRLDNIYPLLMWDDTYIPKHVAKMDTAQYSIMLNNYINGVLAIDPDFVYKNKIDKFDVYLQKNPDFLHNLRSYILSKEWI